MDLRILMVPAVGASIPVNDLKRHNGSLDPILQSSIARVLDRGWFILGPEVQEFEVAFAKFCGSQFCIGVGNGTDALELALRATGVRPGDNVITVSNAGGYSTCAIRAVGANPKYVDIAESSMLMNLDDLASRIDNTTTAVIATHLFGRMMPMPALLEICSERGIPVIEDCAQAHGAYLHGKRAGSWGTIGCFSFYPTKNLGALGDGGAITTNNQALANRVIQLRQYGWRAKYRSDVAGGRNTRLDELQASVLRSKLDFLDSWNERRRTIANEYSSAFAGLGLHTPGQLSGDHVAHLYVVRSGDRNVLQARLRELDVGTDIHYPVPDHLQECFRGEPWAAVSLPVTERCCNEVVTLPCFPELTGGELERVIAAVRKACG